MGGGGGSDVFSKGGSSGSQSSPYASALWSLGSQLFREANPTLKLLFGQMQEALKTGGVGAQIPIIQQAVASARSAQAGALGSAKDAMARLGLGSSPLANSQLASANMNIEQGIAGIPTSMAQQMIGQAGSLASGVTGMGLGTAGTAAGLDTNWEQQWWNISHSGYGGGGMPGYGGGGSQNNSSSLFS